MHKSIPLVSFLLLACSFSISVLGQAFPDSRTDGRYVTVNNAKLWAVTVGKGDPLVLIPGGPGSAHIYMRQFDTLAKDNMLIYYDGYGRGKSETAKNISEYTLARDIEDLEGLRIALHLNKINVLGHSYGGVVAQGYALKYPQNVMHLVLANTFHSSVMWQKNDDNSNHEIKTNYPEVWDTLMKLRNRGYVSSDPKHQAIYGLIPYGFLYSYNPENFTSGGVPYPNSFNTKLYYQMVGRDGDFTVSSDIGAFDYRAKLKNLAMPVLIYGGRYDKVAVPEMMIKFRQYCPQAQFIIFEKSGHNPQVEEPKKLFAFLEAFLSY